MKNFLLSLMPVLTIGTGGFGQNYLIANSNGGDYEMTISKKDFAAVFDSDVAPYLAGSKTTEKYSFEDLTIDDPEPLNSGSSAYLQLKASSSKETITIGITLIKEVLGESLIRLYIPNLLSSNETAEAASGQAGWKCSSVKLDCGGCRKVRENGVVVGCPCISGGDGYCAFETTGGGGGNWPSWLTALLQTILRMF